MHDYAIPFEEMSIHNIDSSAPSTPEGEIVFLVVFIGLSFSFIGGLLLLVKHFVG